MTSPFRLGIVGGGRMGRTHLRALEGLEDIVCVAVAEPFETSAAQLRAAGHTVYSTAAELYGSESLDGVLITVPTDQHIATAAEALEAGLPVLCEKPFGVDPEEIRRLGALARARSLALQIGYWRRFIPGLRDLKDRIESGELGELHLLICSQWDEQPPSLGFRRHSGGIFLDMGVHEIEQARWLLGEDIAEVVANPHPRTIDPEAEGDVDGAQALVAYPSGAQALISLGRFFPGGDIVTAELFATGGHERVEVVTPETGEEPQLEALRRQALAFARYARGGLPEGTTAEDAAIVVETAQRLTRAAGIAVLAEA